MCDGDFSRCSELRTDKPVGGGVRDVSAVPTLTVLCKQKSDVWLSSETFVDKVDDDLLRKVDSIIEYKR